MKKLLLPSIVMVSAYLAIHITAFTVQSAKKSSKKSKQAVALISANQIVADNVKRIIAKTSQTVKASGIKPFRGNQIKTKAIIVESKNQPLDFALLPNRFKIPFENFKENANKSFSITYKKTGTTIEIPANAFVSQSGDPVKGEVEIRYREYTKPSEIFVSGIPMHWQNGEYLESAGMLEIEAWQNGEKLTLAKGAQIEVAMISDFTSTNYNLYAFNDDSQNWAYVNNSFTNSYALPENPTKEEDWRAVSNDSLPKFVSQKIEYSVPTKNVIGFNPDYKDNLHKKENTIYRQASVKLVYDETLFPDLVNMGNYEYKIVTHNYSELEKIANGVMTLDTRLPMGWKDMKMIYPGKWGVVDLQFINDMDTFTLGAEPIVENLGKQKKFANEYYAYAADYEQARKGRLYTLKYKMGMKKVDFEKDTALVKQLKTQFIAQKVERKFLLDKLITWNCDRPFPIKPYEPYAVNFTSDRVSNISMVYAAIPGKNSVFKATDFKRFALVDNGNMILWVLVDENTVAYLTPEMLKEVKWDSKTVNDIEMKSMSLDAFLPMLDREVLSSKEKLSVII